MAEELWEEGRGLDFLESLGPDISATVFSLLDDPADLARATAVSHSWRRFGTPKFSGSAFTCLYASIYVDSSLGT